MRQKNLDLIVCLLLGLVNVEWGFLPNHVAVASILLALPLVFLIPGYTLVEALFIPSAEISHTLIRKPILRILRPLGASDRLILSLGLSLAMVIITGFVLNILPMGLEQSTWAIALAVLSAIFSLTALYKRKKRREHTVVAENRFRVTIYEYMLCLLAIGIVTSSVWYTVINAQQQQQQATFTQFWLVPSKQANNSCAVLVGVQSFEARQLRYDIVITANGTPISRPTIVLAPQNQWYQSLSLKPGQTDTVEVEAKLYRHQQPHSLYREAHMTFNSSGENNARKLQC